MTNFMTFTQIIRAFWSVDILAVLISLWNHMCIPCLGPVTTVLADEVSGGPPFVFIVFIFRFAPQASGLYVHCFCIIESLSYTL